MPALFLVTSMIKNKPSNSIDVPLATVSDDFLSYLAEQGNVEKRQAERNLRDVNEAITNIDNWITRARRETNDIQRRILQRKDEQRELRLQHKQAQLAVASIDDSQALASAQTTLERVRKLKYVDSVTRDGNTIIVTTRLLFTDIRRQSGSRTYLRRCIGAFRIRLNFSNNGFRIENLLFDDCGYPHWSVSSNGSPCYGEHATYFDKAMRDRDLFMMLEYTYAYLLSTDDSAAYTSSNNWIQRRNDTYDTILTQNIRKGNYVVALQPYEQYNPDEHPNYAQVVRTWHGRIHLSFSEPFTFGHTMRGLAKEGHGYVLPVTAVRKITKREYDAQSVDIEALKTSNPLDQIDALPFGSTLADAKNII